MRCRFCDSAPQAFEGHAALGPILDDRPPDGTAFACTLCGSEWIRRYVGEGEFAWLPWRRLVRGRSAD
jgi:hypothetical protein